MMWRRAAILLAFAAVYQVSAQTPVIGGACSLGATDVQIGGKQTQFFLKCENTSESPSGEGVWVVKSRAAAAAAPAPAPAPMPAPAAPVLVAPMENTQPQHRPNVYHKQLSNICEQDLNAHEGQSCAVSSTCLQAHNELPVSYLQCEQTTMMWMRRDCHEGTVFNFEQQACVVPKRVHSLSRQSTSGLVCTYSSCSNSNPCNVGTCNNGYCCSSSSIPSSSNCGSYGCGNTNTAQVYQLCPSGGTSSGSCPCSSGYTCYQGSCCPSTNSYVAYTCPGGGSSNGYCTNGGCASGYSCSNNYCCPNTNPFVCIDGTQAVGACVNSACGTGYTCSNGLCCNTNSSTPRCLDGSPAVGACIPSCTGDLCGNVAVTYTCGTGYTCTTGNICCQTSTCPLGGTPIGPPVNGLCPSGYTLQNNQCCSSTTVCPTGTTNVGPPVNGACPTGSTLTGGSVCCSSTTAVTCAATISNGPCNTDGTCPSPGYSCYTAANYCCPVVDYTNTANIIGPAIQGLCPIGYAMVMIPGGAAEGECVTLQSIPGICAEAVQLGPCGTGCGTGYYCFTAADVCCPTTSLRMSRLHHHPALPEAPRSHLMP